MASAGGNNSVVECDLAKVEVAGSNPVSRSNLIARVPLHPSSRSIRDAGPCGAAARGARQLGRKAQPVRSRQDARATSTAAC